MMFKSNKFFKKSLLAAAVTAAFGTNIAHSQDNGFVLEEIVVTASKRQRTLQDTPIAVTVTGAQAIERSKIVDITDLQSLVPSLRVSTTIRSDNATFSIRGFGNGGGGTEPSVGVNIDGVFRARSSSSISDLPRVQRIEVLSGPQSTLFGKNASAGVISVVTAPPSQEFEAGVEATVGNYNQKIVKSYLSGGVTDSLALSVSGGINQRDGFTEALQPGLKDLNDRDRFNLRAQAFFEPSDSVRLRLIADYSELDEICCTTGAVLNGPTAAVIEALGGELITDEDLFSYTSQTNVDPENKITDQGISLHVDIDYDSFTLTSITAWRKNESAPALGDVDYTSSDLATEFGSEELENFSQEIRLTSTSNGPLSWMAGGFYYKEDIASDGYLSYGEDLRGYIVTLIPVLQLIESMAGFQIYPAGIQVASRASQEDVSYSFFSTVDYQVSDSLTLTAGLNYTNDKKEVNVNQYSNPDQFSALDLNTFAGGAFAPLAAVQIRPPHLGLPNLVEDGKSNDDKVTWLARAAWEANDNYNFYASAATGFKSSSWSLGIFGQPSPDDLLAIQAAGIATSNQKTGSRRSSPEYSTVYELGMKAKFDHGSLNLAVFDQNIQDFQTLAFDGVNFIQTNAGEQAVKGAELNLTYAPNAQWLVTLGATYLDPIYKDFTGAPAPVGSGLSTMDRSGTRPGSIHPLSTTATVTYNLMLDNGISGYVRGEYMYERATELSNDFPGISRQVNTANASAGLDFNNGISAQLWARNLTNDEYFTGGFGGVLQSGTVNSFLNQPRTYGLSMAYTFH